MKKYFLLLVSSVLFVISALAQAAGAYRTAGSGNWNNSSTWEIFDGANWIPAAFPPDPDITTSILIRNGHSVTVNTPTQTKATIDVAVGASLTLQNNFTLNDNTWPGEELLVNGNLSFTGGTLTGSGRFLILGTKNWGAGILDLMGTIAPGATLNITNTVTLQDELTNNGTTNWTSGSIFFQSGTLINNGVWNTNLASVTQFANSSGTNLFNNSASGIFHKYGPATFTNNVPAVNAGQIDIHAGTYLNGNTNTNTGNIDIEAGSVLQQSSTLNLNTGSTITGGGNLNQTGGTIVVNTDIDFSSSLVFNFSAGLVGGPEELTEEGDMNWSGGVVDCQLVIDTNGKLYISNNVTLEADLAVRGECHHNGGSIFLHDGNIIIDGVWISDILSNVQIGTIPGSNHMTVNGTFTKTGTATLTINVPATYNGDCNINGGIFISQDPADYHGNIDIATGCTFRVNDNMSLEAGSSVTGSGSLDQTGGTLSINTPTIFTDLLTYNLSAGLLDGPEELTEEGDMNWSGGTVNCQFVIDADGNLYISNNVTLEEDLDVLGECHHLGGTISLNQCEITVDGTWTSNLSGSVQFATTLAPCHFTNNGDFIKTGTGTLTFNVPATYNGDLNINGGIFISQDPADYHGNIGIATGCTFRVNDNMSLEAGSSVTGDGNFNQTGGTLSMNTPTIFTDLLTFNLSAGLLDGPEELTEEGDMNWTGGTVNCHLVIDTNGKLYISNNVSLEEDLDVLGECHHLGGTISLNQCDITVDGTWTSNLSGSVQFATTLAPCHFTNNGDFIKTGTGTLTINVPATYNGDLNINGGIFISQDPADYHGNIDIATGCTFRVNDNMSLEAGSSVTGDGNFNQTGGVLNINTPTLFPATLDYNLTGGIVDGNSTLTVQGIMNWSVATISSPFIIDIGAILNITNGVILKDELINDGTVYYTSGGIVCQDGTITNHGVLNSTLTSNVQISNTSGVNHFTNDGTFNKSGTGTLTNNIPTAVAGDWWIDGGICIEGNTSTVTGNIHTATGCTFRFGLATTTNINTGASFTGSGVIEFEGIVNFNTPLTAPSGLTVNFKSGTWQGTGSFTTNGIFDWTTGTFDIPTTGLTGSTINLRSGGPKNISKTWTINNGGSISMAQGVTLNNASINVAGEMIYNPPTGSPLAINATGISGFNLSSTATITSVNPSGIINNNVAGNCKGTIKGAGTINNNFSGPYATSYAPGFSPGLITLNSATSLFDDSTTLQIEILNGSGPGTGHDQLQRNGSLVLDGTLHVTQTGTAPLGTYTIINLTSGTITGSFDVVHLPPGYTLQVGPATVTVTKTLNLQFRSKQSGNWNDISTWESAVDGINWSDASQTPSSVNAELITVRNNHTVTITTTTIVNQLLVNTGSNLIISTPATLTVLY